MVHDARMLTYRYRYLQHIIIHNPMHTACEFLCDPCAYNLPTAAHTACITNQQDYMYEPLTPAAKHVFGRPKWVWRATFLCQQQLGL